MLMPNPTTEKHEENVSKHVPFLDLLMDKLQPLKVEQKQMVDYITERMLI